MFVTVQGPISFVLELTVWLHTF